MDSQTLLILLLVLVAVAVVLLVVLVLSATALAINSVWRTEREQAGKQLLAISESKAREVAAWLGERQHDAYVLESDNGLQVQWLIWQHAPSPSSLAGLEQLLRAQLDEGQEALAVLEARLGDWKPAPNAPKLPAVPKVANPTQPRVFLIDQPGAIQSNVYAAQLVPPTGDAGTIDFDFANGVLGGQFSSRLNMNLREDKHWAYGSYSGARNTLGQRPWWASAAVQSDRTADSMKELQKEISEFATGQAPAKPDEIAKIRAANTLELPGAYETAAAVLGQIASNQRYGRPDDYIVQYKARNEAIGAADVAKAAATLSPSSLTWVVVGDLSKVGDSVRALQLGEAVQLDADGNVKK